MKKTFTASFEEVENIIDQSEIDDIYKDKAQRLKSKDVLKMFIVYFILLFPLYISRLFSFLIERGVRKTPEDLAAPIDFNNEYFLMLDNFYYVHWVAFFFLITILIFLFIRAKNILIASLVFNSSLSIYAFALFIYMFKVSQIFVYYSVLRNVYSVLFLIMIVYTIYLCFKKANKIIFNLDEQLKKPKWNITGKQIVSVAILLFGIYQVFKKTGPGKSSLEFERQFIGALLDFFPLVIVFTPLVFLLFVKPLVRYFYLTKYSEQFREKFNYDVDHWNGQL